MITLRQDQMELVEAARDALRNNDSVLARAPCGAGKTIIAGYIATTMQARNKRLIFTVHRNHLLRQTSLTFQRFGLEYGVIAGGIKNPNPLAFVQVASMETLKNRLGAYQADLVIADECHLSASAGHRMVLDKYRADGSKLLGLSASPLRLDGKPLGDIYRVMVQGRPERWMIDRGYLSDYEIIAPSTPSLGGIHKTMGDYDKTQLAEYMDAPDIMGDIVESWKKYANGKRTIAYGVSVAHSIHISEAFRAAGVKAEHLDGESSKEHMRAVIARFASGETLVVTNCMLMVEGFDLSAQAGCDVPIEAVIHARPTQSVALNTQMCGRALRPKPYPAIILDHAANWERHGMPCWEREWSLEGKAKKRQERDDDVPIRRCVVCFRPFKPSPSCPYCGAIVPVKKREPTHDEQRAMAKIDKQRAAAAQKEARETLRRQQKAEERAAKTLEDLQAIARARGYHHKWAERRLALRQGRKW